MSQDFPGGSVVKKIKKIKKIFLPIHETQFLALVWEDPTGLGASKLGHHNR